MRYKEIVCATLLSTSVLADDALEIKTNEIPVTGNPLSLSDDEMVRPVHIMNGIDLQNKKSSSLGSMLDGVPGVSNNSWGDSVGRPVIRGMDRNRVQILNNGMQIKDVSIYPVTMLFLLIVYHLNKLKLFGGLKLLFTGVVQ